MDGAALLQTLESAKRLKDANVDTERETPMELDLGNLAGFDITVPPTDPRELDAFSRDNVQTLVNALFNLPAEAGEREIVVKLPAPTFAIPREKPVPKAKAPTRWEAFAAKKGINKRKRSRNEFDEQTGDFKPRYGYGRAADEDGAIIEVGPNDDPNEDLFEKRASAKRQKLNKQEKREERNRKMLSKPSALDGGHQDRGDVRDKLLTTKTSTASLGRFDREIEGEPRIKGAGKRRKFDAVAPGGGREKAEHLKLMGKVLSKHTQLVDEDRAANTVQQEREEENRFQNRKQRREKGKTSLSDRGSGKTRKSPSFGKKKSSKGKGGK